MSPPVDFLQCSAVLDRLEEWMDGDLGSEEMAAVEIHLDGCSECARELLLAQEIRKEIASLPAFIPSSGLIERVVGAARKGHADSTQRGSSIKTAGRMHIFAVAAAVIFAVVVVGPWQPATPTYTEEEVQLAVDQTKLALSYINSIARRADQQVRSRVLEDRAVSATVMGISRSLKWAGDSNSEKSETPLRELNEGSLS